MDVAHLVRTVVFQELRHAAEVAVGIDLAALVRAHFARIALARCGNDPVLAASMLGVDPGFFRPGGSAVPSPVIRESGQKAP